MANNARKNGSLTVKNESQRKQLKEDLSVATGTKVTDKSLAGAQSKVLGLERPVEEKKKTKEELQNEQKLALAIIGIAPTLIGAALGGYKGGAVGGKVGSEASGSLGEEFYKQGLKEEEKSETAEERKAREAFEIKKIKLTAEEARKTAFEKGLSEKTGGKKLSAKDLLNINEGGQIPEMLTDVEKTIELNPGDFGPVSGMAAAFPYATKARTIDAQLRASSQRFGRYMEGGVLRKEDEEKYRKMMPQLTDTPEVARNKLQIVKRLLVAKQQRDVEVLKNAGYDVSAIRTQESTPEVPSDISGTKPKTRPGENYYWIKYNTLSEEELDQELINRGIDPRTGAKIGTQ